MITQIGSGLSLSIGFNIGALHASFLMLSKHFSNKGVHSNGWLFLTQPDSGVVYVLIWHVMGQILYQSQEALYVVKHPGMPPFMDALHFVSIRMYFSVIYYMTEAFQSL